MNHYVIVTGGRDYADRAAMDEILRVMHLVYEDGLRIIHGAAPGADTLAAEIAEARGIPAKAFPADWTQFGKPAGHIRNAQMAAYLSMCIDKGHTGEVLAFPGGVGTQGMVAEADARGFVVTRV